MGIQELLAKARQEIPPISPQELFKIINNSTEQVIVLDVREKDEVAQFKIPNSYYIPRSYLELEVENTIPDKDTKIVVYCASGARSLYVSKFLKDIGYTNVYNLLGGINGWLSLGLPVEKEHQTVAFSNDSNVSSCDFSGGIGESFWRRYQRHFRIPEVGESGQKKLQASKVLIVGVGGLGCPSLLYLTAAGVGTIGIIDFDVVEESNLQRQILHLSTFIGRPKTESAYFILKSFNPYTNIKTYQQRLCKENIMDIFSCYDIIVDGSDNFATRYLVNDACVFLQKPYIHGSVFRFEGQLMSFWPKNTACYRCIYPQPPSDDLAPTCQETGVLGVVPGVIGILEAVETIKIILNIGEPLYNKLLCYNVLTHSFRTVTIRKNANCPICSNNPIITSLDESVNFCHSF